MIQETVEITCVGCTRRFHGYREQGRHLPGLPGLYGACAMCEQNVSDLVKHKGATALNNVPVYPTAFSKLKEP